MTLLAVDDLTVSFAARGAPVRAVNGLSLAVDAGQSVGVVGESGSGKSVSALALLGLLGPTARVERGTAHFEGIDLLRLSRRDLRAIRGRRIGMVFQDPMSSLNPVLRIGRQIEEPLRKHRGLGAAARRTEVTDLLGLVGIPEPERVADSYPHQLSGGMRQRVMTAMALACRPSLLIADEPTTALDVTIQAQVLELFRDLRRRIGMALMLITHDLGIVAGTTDRVAVVYAGRVVETGPTQTVLADPRHPYTRGLLASLPRIDAPRTGRLRSIRGTPPEPSRLPSGCPFAPRCSERLPRCTAMPALKFLGKDRAVACWPAQAAAGFAEALT
jgi:oligopeptide/dipeptide ABC transporter ATP-binding protein